MFDGGNSSSVWSGYGAPRVELPLVAGQAVPIGGWTMVCTIGINLILSYLSSMFDGGNSSGVWSGYGAPKLQEWNCHWWLEKLHHLVAGLLRLLMICTRKLMLHSYTPHQNTPLPTLFSLPPFLCSAMQCGTIARRCNAIE